MPTFNNGDRVRFTREDRPERTLVGTVEGTYPADHFYLHGKRIEVEESVILRPDVLPEWWAYPDNDVFCPSIDELVLLSD